MDTIEKIDFYTKSIERTLESLIPNSSNILHKGARYLLFAPSKRIRPLIVLAVAEMLNVQQEEALHPACAIELIHTYSLIHDDLPCMDNDDVRRGQPSLHKVYDEATALLIGDYLLTYAFEVLAEAPIDAERRIELVKLLSKQAGCDGMIGGQLLDLGHGEAPLEEIHEKKTGALLIASFQTGGVLAKASFEKIVQLTILGSYVGLLFQLVDDILDGEYSGRIESGKQNASELANRALNLVPPNGLLLKSLIEKILHQI